MIRTKVMSLEGEFMRRSIAIAATVTFVLMAAPAASAKTLELTGTYVQLAPCVPADGGSAGRAAQLMVAVRCANGVGTLEGDLLGNTRYQNGDGAFDTRRSRGTVVSRDTFYGYGPSGRRGTLVMTTRTTIDSARTTRISKVVGGTEGFEGATGTLRFHGAFIGSGKYTGTIELPGKHRVGRGPN